MGNVEQNLTLQHTVARYCPTAPPCLQDPTLLKKLDVYANMLFETALPAGFIGQVSRETLNLRHILDSVLPLTNPSLLAAFAKDIKVCDLGTGAGLPGLPLAIALPDVQFFLADSASKRLNFVNEVVLNLQLQNVKTIHCEADDLSAHLDDVDLVTFRAFRKPLASLELALQCTKIGAKAMYWRARPLDFSDPEVSKRLQSLGWSQPDFIDFGEIGEIGNRGVHVFQRNSASKAPYPRKFKKIRKEQLVVDFG